MQVPEIDVEAATELLRTGEALFLDVRDPGSFGESHVPGACQVDDRTLGAFLASADKARKVVVYCYHGHMSLGGAAYLLEQGFEDVCSLAGGFEAWELAHPEGVETDG